VIRQQMEETRASLQDKLEVLEQQVMNTVEDANQTVETVKETVEAVKDSVTETVETVKETVQGTVETVKDTVHDTVTSVKEAFNFERQMREHPWPMFAGAALVGFVGGRLLARLTTTPAPVGSARVAVQGSPLENGARYAPPTPALYRENGHGNGAKPDSASPADPGLWSTIANRYGDEIDKLKGLAVTAVGGIVRQFITESAPEALKDSIVEIVDGMTTKLGGKPLEEPILASEPQSSANFERMAS